MVGVQYRDVFCIRLSDGAVVDPNLCPGPEPTTALSVCNTQPCTGYNWMANANWGVCGQGADGLWTRNRSFHCHAANGVVALYSDCTTNAGKLPVGVIPCAPGVCSDANGCPSVQIGSVLNYCNAIPHDCTPGTSCAGAASDLDDAFSSLGTSATVAATCIDTYNAGLAPAAQANPSLIAEVKARLGAGETVCGALYVGAADTVVVGAWSGLVTVLAALLVY